MRAAGPPISFPLPKGSYNSDPNTWTQDQGVDIAAPGHTPLLAIADGTIVGHGIGGFGPSAPILKTTQTVQGQHYIYYGHAGPGNMIPDGTQVTGGQTIGEVGAGIVGISTGPHLEVGFSDSAGTPVPATSSAMKSLLVGLHNQNLPTSPIASAVSSGVDTVTGAAASVAGDAVSAAFGALWDTIKGSAVYAGLFVLFVIGGAVLVARGLRGTTEGHPNPEPAQ